MTANDLLTTPTLHPNDATNNDRDVYTEINAIVQQCNPFETTFFHVLGHQDKNQKNVIAH